MRGILKADRRERIYDFRIFDGNGCNWCTPAPLRFQGGAGVRGRPPLGRPRQGQGKPGAGVGRRTAGRRPPFLEAHPMTLEPPHASFCRLVRERTGLIFLAQKLQKGFCYSYAFLVNQPEIRSTTARMLMYECADTSSIPRFPEST